MAASTSWCRVRATCDIKVNGQFVNLHTYALNAGIEDSTDTGNETSEQSFKVDGGKLYDADCDLLTELASGR